MQFKSIPDYPEASVEAPSHPCRCGEVVEFDSETRYCRVVAGESVPFTVAGSTVGAISSGCKTKSVGTSLPSIDENNVVDTGTSCFYVTLYGVTARMTRVKC